MKVSGFWASGTEGASAGASMNGVHCPDGSEELAEVLVSNVVCGSCRWRCFLQTLFNSFVEAAYSDHDPISYSLTSKCLYIDATCEMGK